MLQTVTSIFLFKQTFAVPSLKYSITKTKKNGSHRSTFVGNITQLPSDVIDYALLPAQRLLAGNRFTTSS